MFTNGDRVSWEEMHKGTVTGRVVSDAVCRVTNSMKVRPDGNPREGWKGIGDLRHEEKE